MSDLRKKFEELPEIKSRLCWHIWFNTHGDNKYDTYRYDLEDDVQFMNGAWYVFQEKEKQINNALDFTENVHSENWQESIHCIKEVLK